MGRFLEGRKEGLQRRVGRQQLKPTALHFVVHGSGLLQRGFTFDMSGCLQPQPPTAQFNFVCTRVPCCEPILCAHLQAQFGVQRGAAGGMKQGRRAS